MSVTKHPWRASRAGRGKHHPAALGPHLIGDRRIGPVGRVLGGVCHHFGLVDDRPFFEIVDAADIGRQQAISLEAALSPRNVAKKIANSYFFLPDFNGFFACERSGAATPFSSLEDDLLPSSFPAFEACFFSVTIANPSHEDNKQVQAGREQESKEFNRSGLPELRGTDGANGGVGVGWGGTAFRAAKPATVVSNPATKPGNRPVPLGS